MKDTIWKFRIPIQDDFELEMPDKSKIIYVDIQGGEPFLWAIVPKENQVMRKKKFRLVGTGHSFNSSCISYCGSFMLLDGSFVGHLFDVGWIQ